jgi:hypothetical protein
VGSSISSPSDVTAITSRSMLVMIRLEAMDNDEEETTTVAEVEEDEEVKVAAADIDSPLLDKVSRRFEISCSSRSLFCLGFK